MKKVEIERKIKEIINNRLLLSIDSATYRELSLLDPRNGLVPRDLLMLFMALQQEFNIAFDENDIIESRFDYFNNIVEAVMAKVV